MSSSRHPASRRGSSPRPTGSPPPNLPHVSGDEATKPNNGLPLQNRTIDTASALWSGFVERGGLDLARYDTPLLEELANTLHLPSDGFAAALEREQVSVETLFKQILRIVQPYAGMTRDILALFARASARRSNENLRMRFEFADSVRDCEFDLFNFREWESRLQRVIRAVEVGEFNVLDAYELRHAFIEEGTTYRLQGGRWYDLPPPDDRVGEWLNRAARGELSAAELPPPPPTSDEELSLLLRKVWGFLDFSLRSLAPRNEGQLDEIDSGILDGDSIATIVRGAYLLAPRDDRLRQRLRPIFDRIPTHSINISVVLEELDQILCMPVWKRRHELYAVWVGSRIIAAMGPETEIHQVEGSILFSFRGSHLATLPLSPRGNLHLWSELRTPLSRPEGKSRKAGIQPDYVLSREPVTHPGTSLLVVESKQYLQPSKQNFAAALLDYSRGHPNAQILLVNYGPGNEAILEAVRSKAPAGGSRTRIIGHFRPGSTVAMEEFEAAVQAVLPVVRVRTSEQEAPLTRPPGPIEASIQLFWQAHPVDLDLHCWVSCPEGRDDHVSYRNRVLEREGTKVWLDGDVQNGWGPETIQLSGRTGQSFHVAVHNFSKERQLAGCDARIEFRTGLTQLFLQAPAHGDGEWWLVLEYDCSQNKIRINNTISPTPGRCTD